MTEFSPKHILIVDDCEDLSTLLKTLLEHRGFKVSCAGNGREALSLIDACQVVPDLILLDANMPVMNGHEFRIIQKETVRLENIPVVIMSGDTNIDLSIEMLEPESILPKPLRLDHLFENVATLM